LIVAGLAVLVGFFVWERRLGGRADGQPLLDLRLFRSPSFTWGVILAAIAVMAMIGVLFTMPQYFQGVAGTDAMGSGLRLLPLIGGLIVGALPADRIVGAIGAKLTVAIGFVLLVVGLALGAGTHVGTSGGFIAMWMAILGLGMGLAIATSSSAALAELSEENSAIGSAVLQAVNKTGGPLGTAILGSVLSTAYLARIDVSGLPAVAAHAVRESIFGGVAVAHAAHSDALLQSVRLAFAHGMDVSLIVSAGIAAVGVLLALVFLPSARASGAAQRELPPKQTDVVIST